MTKRFAVATKTGYLVDEHLGHAGVFEIYETDGVKSREVAKREVLPFCGGPEDCLEFEKKIERISCVLEDCDGIVALMAGMPPARELYRRGLPVYTVSESIGDALTMIWRGEVAPCYQNE